MRLDSLYISEFRNLSEFRINFDKGSFTTAILGRNGTGKSNLLEALIIIFRDLILDKPPAFSYELTYECRGKEVHVEANPQRDRAAERLKFEVRDEKKPEANFRRIPKAEWLDYLPSYIFGYYSGNITRMKSLFDEYYQRLFAAMVGGKSLNIPPLIYAQLIYSQFALLAFIDEENTAISEFLKEHLRIQELVSALFIMHKPPWTSREGDPRFWNARGEVQVFLDKLYEHSLAPLKIENQRTHVGLKEDSRLDHFYLYLPNDRRIANLAKEYPSSQAYFRALQSTDLSQVISEVRIRLKIIDSDNQVTYREMSEGEQQLLMVLGLLRFTKTDEALFLLDEPDTHLNPTWSIRYLEFLEKVVGSQPKSHIILTTHNPLLISGLRKEQVQIINRDEKSGHIFAEIPDQDPKGMGVAAILTSDLFGLRSTLDPETQGELDERRELAAKNNLTQEELERLNVLNLKLEGLDYAISTRDPYYSDFDKTYKKLYSEYLKRIYQRQDPAVVQEGALTTEQREAQQQLTEEILRELMAEEDI